MIRHSSSSRRGISLVEGAYVVAIAAAILGGVWAATATLYQNVSLTRAGQELQSIVLAVRLARFAHKPLENESLEASGLSGSYTGHYKGHVLFFNPWGGAVTIFAGSSAGRDPQLELSEFTVRFDGVPSKDCKGLVTENTKQDMRGLGLVTIAISPPQGQGQAICFATDVLCKVALSSISDDVISKLCVAHDPMTVMFTYTSD